MSYDLFFKPNERLTKEAFESYFSNRNCYRLEKNQAWYENEDTGVYFAFEWNEDDGQGDGDPAAEDPYAASFNVNYYRPQIFGLEAEPEVTAFIERFDPEIFDPQTHGMGDGPYSGEGFLRGWNEGNRVAVRAMTGQPVADTPFTLPEAEIARIWRWNLGRKALEERLQVFVPKIMLCVQNDAVKSICAWTDAIPIALPRVDVISLVRFALAPKRFFFLRRTDVCPIPWDEAGEPLANFVHRANEPEYWLFDYPEEVPAGMASWFASQNANAAAVTGNGIPMDMVISAELVAQAADAAALQSDS